jgi:putative flippase GtrA
MIGEAAEAALCYVGNYGLLSSGLEIVLNQHSLAYSVSALVCSIYHQYVINDRISFDIHLHNCYNDYSRF